MRKGIVTIHGNPLTLIGPELKLGDKALTLLYSIVPSKKWG